MAGEGRWRGELRESGAPELGGEADHTLQSVIVLVGPVPGGSEVVLRWMVSATGQWFGAGGGLVSVGFPIRDDDHTL